MSVSFELGLITYNDWWIKTHANSLVPFFTRGYHQKHLFAACEVFYSEIPLFLIYNDMYWWYDCNCKLFWQSARRRAVR
jgi:hypothetical protein